MQIFNAEKRLLPVKSRPILHWSLFALTFLGFVDSIWLFYGQSLGSPGDVCFEGASCQEVMNSRYAWIGPLPISLFGVGFYLAVGLLLWKSRSGEKSWSACVVAGSFVGLLASGIFVLLQARVIGAWCPFCLASTAINIAAAIGSGFLPVTFREMPGLIFQLRKKILMGFWIITTSLLSFYFFLQSGARREHRTVQNGLYELNGEVFDAAAMSARERSELYLADLDRFRRVRQKAYEHALESHLREKNSTPEKLFQEHVDAMRKAAGTNADPEKWWEPFQRDLVQDAVRSTRLKLLIPEPMPPLTLQWDPRQHPTLGLEEAPVRIEIFSDFECRHCAAAHVALLRLAMDFPKQVSLIHHFHPLANHPEAEGAALRAAWAFHRGKFWEVASALYENHSRLGTVAYLKIASKSGLDAKTMEKEISQNGPWKKTLEADKALAKSLGLDRTPAIFINGVLQTELPSREKIRRILK